jgi:hypothetical protein
MIRASHRQTRVAVVAGYAAATWALLFAVPHLHWGVGGVVGLDTALNREIGRARSSWFLALNWGIGLFCLDEYLRLARWFLFLWLPWFTLGAVAWGALASRLHVRCRLGGMDGQFQWVPRPASIRQHQGPTVPQGPVDQPVNIPQPIPSDSCREVKAKGEGQDGRHDAQGPGNDVRARVHAHCWAGVASWRVSPRAPRVV